MEEEETFFFLGFPAVKEEIYPYIVNAMHLKTTLDITTYF